MGTAEPQHSEETRRLRIQGQPVHVFNPCSQEAAFCEFEARWSTDRQFQKRLQSYPEGEKKGKKSSGIQGLPQQEGGQSQPRILESVFKKKKQRRGAELCAAQLRAPGSLRSSIVRGSADRKCVVSDSNGSVRTATGRNFYGFYFLGEEIAGI